MKSTHFNLAFPQITNALSKAEAKEKFPDIATQSKIMRGFSARS